MELLCLMVHDGSKSLIALETQEGIENKEEEQQSIIANMNAALETLCIIAKSNSVISQTNNNKEGNQKESPLLNLICNAVLTILLRISCFEDGCLHNAFQTSSSELLKQLQCHNLLRIVEIGNAPAAAIESQTPKKDKKNKKEKSLVKSVPINIIVVSKAQQLFIQLLSDTAHVQTLYNKQTVMDNLLEVFNIAFEYSMTASIPLRYVSNCGKSIAAAAAGEGAEEDNSTEEEPRLTPEEMNTIVKISANIAVRQAFDPSSNTNRLREVFGNLFAHSLFYTLSLSTADEEDDEFGSNMIYMETLNDLIQVAKQLSITNVSTVAHVSINNNESSENNPLLQLLHCCEVFILDSSDDVEAGAVKTCTIRGIKSSVKKLWHVLWSTYNAANNNDTASHKQALLDAVLHMLVGEDLEEEEGSVDGDEMSETGEDVSEEVGGLTLTEDPEEEEDDNEAEEGSDDENNPIDSDSDNEDGVELKGMDVEHHEGADEALAKMIKLQQLNRKQGLLSRQRQEFVLRARMFDIFETILQVMIQGKNNDNALFGLLLPLLKCIKKTAVVPTKKQFVSAEKTAFAQRLQVIIEQKVSIVAYSYFV